MKSLAEKISKLSTHLDEFAPVFLWALFESEDSPDKWDIVLSSHGSDQNAAAAIRKISKQLVPQLDRSELAAVSRIVVVPSEEPSVMALASSMAVQGGMIEIRDSNFMGLAIKHALLFRTQRPPQTRHITEPTEARGATA